MFSHNVRRTRRPINTISQLARTRSTSPNPPPTPYILTLHTDPAHYKRLTDLRSHYYPPGANKLGADVVLFRALPYSQYDTINADISAAASTQQSFPIATSKAYILPKNRVMIDAHVPPPAREIYDGLKEKWEGFLTQSDKNFKPRYIIQEGKKKEEALLTLEEIEDNFEGSQGQVEGLSLFRYQNRYWRHIEDYMFPPSNQSVDSGVGGRIPDMQGMSKSWGRSRYSRLHRLAKSQAQAATNGNPPPHLRSYDCNPTTPYSHQAQSFRVRRSRLSFHLDPIPRGPLPRFQLSTLLSDKAIRKPTPSPQPRRAKPTHPNGTQITTPHHSKLSIKEPQPPTKPMR